MKRRFGQHFLKDHSVLTRIVRLAAIDSEDTVLEIGPGRGALTRELAAVARRVIAIEIDRDLIPALTGTLPANVTVIEGDALEVPWPEEAFHVVANLPYNAATPLIRRFIEMRSRIRDVTVMVQKEVAERITASPGPGAYGPLSVLVQYYANARYAFTVPPGAFTPKPKVDSAVVRLEWKPGTPDARDFTDFVHQAFSSRRKTLANNLSRMATRFGRSEIDRRLADAGISLTARPEELSVEQFMDVYNRWTRE
ncbi:MAG TPA: 16S rRNA (adenine(1518)-N(6)/adenine(1519)-N(6))-dimethyltransferase RsmA [Terriglobia bacterium]|nr:16S rRNA (adenine(1518)-N(6)/adenine(1519)-N(6))-dimethyltransferase RsmA [Terriglobia bacterium]